MKQKDKLYVQGSKAGMPPFSLVDLGDGKAVRRAIIQLAGPSLVEMLLINFVQMLSMILVGRVGQEAIAAVGLTGSVYSLLIAAFMTLDVGTTVIVARSMGAGDVQAANRAANQSVTLNILMSIVIIVLGYMFAGDLLRIMGATNAVLEQGTHYAEILFLSTGFNTISMALTAILRGMGDTRTPMKINVLANILNVALGFPLIYGFMEMPGLGVTGAAYATMISQFISMLWVVLLMVSGKSTIRLSWGEMIRLDKITLGRILKIGLPAAVEQVALRGGMLTFVTVAASLGTAALAATQISFSIFGLTFMPGMAFSIAASTLVGQALGAAKPDLAEKCGWQVRKMGMIVYGAMGLFIILFAPYLVMMYTPDPVVVEKGAIGLRIMGFIQVSAGTSFILAGALRGAGDTRYPLYITLLGVWGFRVFFSLIFVYLLHWDIAGIWLAAAADQVVRSLFIVRRYKWGAWKLVKV